MKHTEKVVRQKKEDRLKCPYCGRLSPLGTANCPNCGAVLTENDVITVSVEKTEDSTETINNIDDIIDNVLDEREKKRRVYVIAAVIAIIIIGVLCYFSIKDKSNVKVVEVQTTTNDDVNDVKEVEEGVYVGYVLPNGAILIDQKQVPVEGNPSKYRTEYTYTFNPSQ